LLFRLRARTSFPLTLPSSRFLPDRMNGAGIPRPERLQPPRAPASRKPPVGLCNQREDRAHPERPVSPHAACEHRRLASEGLRAAERRLPGWESSSRSTGRPDSTKLRHEAREACSESEADTLVGQRGSRLPGEASPDLVPRGSPSARRANGKTVERTQVPLRRSEPRFFTVALRRTPAEPERRRPFFTRSAV
jgi:hypothetical protein